MIMSFNLISLRIAILNQTPSYFINQRVGLQKLQRIYASIKQGSVKNCNNLPNEKIVCEPSFLKKSLKINEENYFRSSYFARKNVQWVFICVHLSHVTTMQSKISFSSQRIINNYWMRFFLIYGIIKVELSVIKRG